MALRKCKECGAKLSAKAETCPHCGAPGPKAESEKAAGTVAAVGCLLVVILVIIVVAMGSTGKDSSGGPGPAAQAPVYTEEQKDAAKKLFMDLAGQGVVRKTDLPSGDIWYDDLVWLAMNRDQKEQAIRTMATAREVLAGSPLIEIKSYSNDEPLGKFGLLGVKILR